MFLSHKEIEKQSFFSRIEYEFAEKSILLYGLSCILVGVRWHVRMIVKSELFRASDFEEKIKYCTNH